HRFERHPLDLTATFEEQFGAGAKPLFRKIRVDVDDEQAAVPMRPRNAADQRHLIPLHGRPSRISKVTVFPSRSPGVDASVRNAAAVRACLPITSPKSPGATKSSMRVVALCCDSTTRTSSG